MKSTYKRNGTLNLFAALEIAIGQVYVQTTEQKKREDCRRFLDSVVAELSAEREIHDQLRAAIEAFVARTNANPKPFHWRKREVKGSQLRNTIINLCN